MSEQNGGCLCGEIQYSFNTDPAVTAICHCSHCQRQTGTSFSIVVGIPTESLSVTGDTLSTFHDVSASGNPVDRHFCQNCGSPIFTSIEAMPETVYVKAGTLNDKSWLQPQIDIWCASAQPWVEIDKNRPRYDGDPE